MQADKTLLHPPTPRSAPSLPAAPNLIPIPTSHPRLFFLPSPSCDPEDKPQQLSPATRRHQLTTAISSSDRNPASRALCELAPRSPSQAPHPSTAAGCSGMLSRASCSHSKALVPSCACTHEASASSGAGRVHLPLPAQPGFFSSRFSPHKAEGRDVPSGEGCPSSRTQCHQRPQAPPCQNKAGLNKARLGSEAGMGGQERGRCLQHAVQLMLLLPPRR